MVGSGLLLVLAVGMGVVAIWDVGGLATAIRARFELMPILGASYRRLPSWVFRLFGIWCIVIGIGQLIFVYAIMHGTSH